MKKKEKIKNKFGGLCAYTGKPLGEDWQIDHIKPKAQGGSNDLDNLLPALKIVNHYKRCFDLETFRNYMVNFHIRLSKLPKTTRVEKTKNRIIYMNNIASAFGITPEKGFDGKFYFENDEH